MVRLCNRKEITSSYNILEPRDGRNFFCLNALVVATLSIAHRQNTKVFMEIWYEKSK